MLDYTLEITHNEQSNKKLYVIIYEVVVKCL